MKITLRQLLYFDALAREMHFGRAAARVSVTQPAMSAQIRELEGLLGGALVDRSGKTLTLTPLGRVLLPHAQGVLAATRRLEATARASEGLAVPLTLGIIPTVAPYLVPPLLPLARGAGGNMTIREAVTGTLLRELGSGEIDAAVLALPVAGEALDEVELFTDRFLLARPPAKAGDLPAIARPDQIDPDRLLLLDEGHCLSGQALGACGLRPEGARQRLGAASLATLTRLVASGQGVTLLPEIAARTDGRGLRLSRFAAPEPGRVIGLTRPGQGVRPAWFDPLADLLRRAAERIPRADL